jgi:hypothetical protein
VIVKAATLGAVGTVDVCSHGTRLSELKHNIVANDCNEYG